MEKDINIINVNEIDYENGRETTLISLGNNNYLMAYVN